MKRNQIEFRRFNHTLGEMEYSSEMAGGLEQFFSNDCCSELSDEYLFAGVLDCEGVKIFEGDIVNFEYNDFSLCFEVAINDIGCFVARNHKQKNDFYFLDDFDYKVIGNIHQHKELLGDTK